MAYSEELEMRLVQLTKARRDIYNQKMFGGLGFFMCGNMCFGIWKDNLILRLGKAQAQVALRSKNVVPFDITGRPMNGWVMVKPAGIRTRLALMKWVNQSIDFVIQLSGK